MRLPDELMKEEEDLAKALLLAITEFYTQRYPNQDHSNSLLIAGAMGRCWYAYCRQLPDNVHQMCLDHFMEIANTLEPG